MRKAVMISAKPSDESLGFVVGFVTALRGGQPERRRDPCRFRVLAVGDAPNERIPGAGVPQITVWLMTYLFRIGAPSLRVGSGSERSARKIGLSVREPR